MPLRVLSYNILYGGEDRLPHITNVIARQQPDVVALLEANERANVEQLAQRLGMHLVFGQANSEFHVAWMSRLPIMRTQNHRLAVLTKTLLEIEVLWQQEPVSLFATHLRAGRDQQSDDYRSTEVRAILDVLRRYAASAHLLAGDLNSLHPADRPATSLYLATAAEKGEESMPEEQFPRTVIPLLLEAGYTDCYRALHPSSPGYTYKLPAPSLRLDYLFASPALAHRLLACDVVTDGEARIASDHFPLEAAFFSPDFD